MTNNANLLRSLIIYGICLPLAILLGYLLTTPDQSSVSTIGVVLAILIIPILLRFHHAFLVISWNLGMMMFFLPGSPTSWLTMSIISFLIFLGQRILDKRFRFLTVPEINRPLIILLLVVIITAEATGGIGLRYTGGDTYGGKRYLVLIGSILGYFALTGRRIPPEKAYLYLALFFLSGVFNFLEDWYSLSGPVSRYLFLFFPPTMLGPVQLGETRFGGLTLGAMMVFSYMLARYGIRNLFFGGRPWRLVLFCFFCVIGLLGGYRSSLMTVIITFSIQFYLEGMHKTKLLPFFAFIVLSATFICFPLMHMLPSNIQRSFAFIPFAPIDPEVRMNADVSSDWRIRMWHAVIPEIPNYLLLGKGLSISKQDFTDATNKATNQGAMTEDWWGSLTAGDFHNGPLSVLITFGIWGMLAFLWFIYAGLKVLYNNYRYGDPNLRTINACLYSLFLGKTVIFFFVFGGFYADLQIFLGWLALGICLNGGAVRAPQTASVSVAKTDNLANLLPRPKSAFSR